MLANPLISRTSRFFRLMHSFKNCETMPRENRICIALFYNGPSNLDRYIRWKTVVSYGHEKGIYLAAESRSGA